MVDVSRKVPTARWARAEGRLLLNAATLRHVRTGKTAKGDLWAVARSAGILAAKRVGDFVPLAHPLALAHCEIRFEILKTGVRVESLVKTMGPTGVELEALMAAWGSLLTLYDMIKALQRDAAITGIVLLEKGGGKSYFLRRRKR
jgi:cyclic pyranopterin monophosphate synthase